MRDFLKPFRICVICVTSLYVLKNYALRYPDGVYGELYAFFADLARGYELLIFTGAVLLFFLSSLTMTRFIVLVRALTRTLYYSVILYISLQIGTSGGIRDWYQAENWKTYLLTYGISFGVIYFCYWLNQRNWFSIINQRHSKKIKNQKYAFFEMEPQKRVHLTDSQQIYHDKIINYIRNFSSAGSHLSLALVSQWGTGKSTLLRVLKDSLSEDNHVIMFSLLISDTSESILNRFSEGLEDIFQKERLTGDKTLEQYVSSLLYLIGNGNSSIWDRLFKKNDQYTYDTNKAHIQDRIDYIARHKQKKAGYKDISGRIIIIIDDIDRICHTNKDVRKVFNFINEICYFNNCVTVYSFSDEQVNSRMKEYLDKFINKKIYMNNKIIFHDRRGKNIRYSLVDKCVGAFAERFKDDQSPETVQERRMLQHINEWYIKYIDMFIQAVNDYELANPSEDATAFVKDLRHEVQKLHNNLRSQKAFLQELLHLFQVANYFGLAVEGKRQAAENEFADMCKILFYLATISLSGEQDLLSLCETALEPAPSLAGIRGQFIMLIQRLISTEYLHCFVRD